MSVSINKLTVNTKVNKQGGEEKDQQNNQQGGGSGGGLSKMEREELLEEFLHHVEEMLDYRLRP